MQLTAAHSSITVQSHKPQVHGTSTQQKSMLCQSGKCHHSTYPQLFLPTIYPILLRFFFMISSLLQSIASYRIASMGHKKRNRNECPEIGQDSSLLQQHYSWQITKLFLIKEKPNQTKSLMSQAESSKLVKLMKCKQPGMAFCSRDTQGA